jgi:hypothetical protein
VLRRASSSDGFRFRFPEVLSHGSPPASLEKHHFGDRFDDLKSMELKKQSPSACRKLISGRPKILGMSQFQSSHTGRLEKSAPMTAMAMLARTMVKIFNVDVPFI